MILLQSTNENTATVLKEKTLQRLCSSWPRKFNQKVNAESNQNNDDVGFLPCQIQKSIEAKSEDFKVYLFKAYITAWFH